jgi:predicted nucleotidyltransferase
MEFDLAKHTHFLCVTGSHAFGTATPESDLDLKGIAVAPKEYFFGYAKNFEQNDRQWMPDDYPFKSLVSAYADRNDFTVPDQPLDQTIYALKKFMKLAADCNPNILTILFAAESDVLLETPLAKQLRVHRDMFLSAKVRYTYSGYAVSQLKRIERHKRWLLDPPSHKPTRLEYGLPEGSTVPADQRQAAEKLIDQYMRDWLCMNDDLDRSLLATIHNRLTDFISLVIHKDEDLEDMARTAAVKKLGMTENYIKVLQAEKAYTQAKREYKQYTDWKKNRNPDRAKMEAESGYDRKHAYHLIRLQRMCNEILTTGKVLVKRPDASELLDIRNGKWTYEAVLTHAKELEQKSEDLYKNKQYVVPKKSAVNALNNLCVKLHQEFV